MIPLRPAGLLWACSRKEVSVAEPGKSQSGGNLKYILGGLLLLGGAGGVALMLRPSAPPTPPSAPPAPEAPANAERVNPMAQPELILEEQKDAGAPAQVAEAEKPKAHVAKEARDEWDCDGDLSRAAL